MFSFNKKASTTPAADSPNDHPNPETTVVPADFLPLTSERVEPRTESPKPLVDENKPKSPETPANEHEPESPEPLVDKNKPESLEPPADEHTSKSRRLSTVPTSTERRKSKAAEIADFFAGAAANTAAANTAAANTAAANTAAANTAAPTLPDIGVSGPSHHPQIAQSLSHFRFPGDDNSAVTLFPTDNNNNSSTTLLLPTSRRTSAKNSKPYAAATESESESETNTPPNHDDDPAPTLNGIDFNQVELGGPHDATPPRGSPSGSKSRSKSIHVRSRSKPRTRKISRHTPGTRRRKLKQLRQRIANALRAFARLIRNKAERVLAMFKSKKTKTKTKAKAKQGMVVLNLYHPYGSLSLSV
jgi:hypothetical protein